MALSDSQKTDLLFKKFFGKGKTNDSRQFFEEPEDGRSIVFDTQVWAEANQIPTTAPTPGDGGITGVVQQFVDRSMTAVPGTSNSFTLSDLVDSIPFNFGDGSYNYTVKDSLGTTIPFGDGDWVVDNDAGVLTFNGTVPSNMPPQISFWKYVGNKGISVADGAIDTAQIVDEAVTRDKMDLVTTTQAFDMYNVSIAASVAASALTVELKTQDGGDPAAGDACWIGFRNSTATNGSYVFREVTSAASLTVSSGSTLGTANGVESDLFVYAIDNAGTIELAIAGSNFIDEGTLVSTTAEGGAGAADDGATLYSTTARSNVAARLIGRITSTQATAGTWASSPTELSVHVLPVTSGGGGSGTLTGSTLRLEAASGYGSGSNKVPTWTNTVANTLGAEATATINSTVGVEIQANQDILVAVSFTYGYSGTTDGFGISLNGGGSSALSTLSNTARVSEAFSHTTNRLSHCGGIIPLATNDVIRPHTESGASATSRCSFIFTVIGDL